MFLEERIPGVSDIAGKTITLLDIAEALWGPSSGADTVRLILSIWRAMRTIAQLFASSNEDGILLAESCTFKPGQDKLCVGGIV